MNLGLLEPLVRVHIHVPKALCVRFYDRAGTNPLLSLYVAAFAIKDCIKTLYRYLFYYMYVNLHLQIAYQTLPRSPRTLLVS